MEYTETLLSEQFKEILSAKRRHFISKTIYLVGDKVAFVTDGEEYKIHTRISVRDSIYDSEHKVYGFEVGYFG